MQRHRRIVTSEREQVGFILAKEGDLGSQPLWTGHGGLPGACRRSGTSDPGCTPGDGLAQGHSVRAIRPFPVGTVAALTSFGSVRPGAAQ
jgi:hypothetical protein